MLASLADRVRHACENVGFFYAADHPIPEDVVSRLFAAMDRFFALPTEEKMAAHLHLNPAMRGYEPLFETKNDPSSSALGDLKEAFSMGDDPLDPEQRRYWPFADDVPSQWKHQNIWPPAAPWLRDALYEYYHHVVPFARALTAVFALAMGLQENALDGMFNFPITGMRVCTSCTPVTPRLKINRHSIILRKSLAGLTLVSEPIPTSAGLLVRTISTPRNPLIV